MNNNVIKNYIKSGIDFIIGIIIGITIGIGNYLKNKNIQLIIIGILFAFWFFSFGNTCPCGSNKKKILYECYRFEIFGVQPNHFYFFLPLGFFFPEYFFTIQIIGVLWELFEYYIDVNPKLLNKFGGCLDPKMKYSEFAGIIGNGTSGSKGSSNNKNNNYISFISKIYDKWYYNNIVGSNHDKYVNPIDRLFGIKGSRKHGWHHSIAEIILNIFSFLLGSYLKSINVSYLFILLIILICFILGF